MLAKKKAACRYLIKVQVAARKVFFGTFPFVARKMTPRSRKSGYPGYGPLLGCRSALDSGREKYHFFGDVETKNGQNLGKSSSDGFARYKLASRYLKTPSLFARRLLPYGASSDAEA